MPLTSKPIKHSELSNEQKRTLLKTHFHASSGKFEYQSAARDLISVVEALDLDDNGFDETFEKMLFGFILWDHCRFDDNKPISHRRLMKALDIKIEGRILAEQYAPFLIDIGEKILGRKVPFEEKLIRRCVDDKHYGAYLIDTLKRHAPLNYQAYKPIAIKAQMIELFPQALDHEILSELLHDVDIESKTFDLITMGLVIQTLEANTPYRLRYPLDMNAICEQLELKRFQDEKSAIDFYMKIGQAILVDKTLPCYEITSISSRDMDKMFSDHIKTRHQELYAPLSYDIYNAVNLLRQLDSLVPENERGALEHVDIEDPEFDRMIAGATIYTQVTKQNYPISTGELYELTDSAPPKSLTERKAFYLSLGKLALDMQTIPLVLMRSFKQLDREPYGIDGFPKQLLAERFREHHYMSITHYETITALKAILPEEAQALFIPQDYLDTDGHTDKADNRQKCLAGAIVYRFAKDGHYPLSWKHLLKLGALETPDSSDDFKQLFLHLGSLIFDFKQIPFDTYGLHKDIDGFSERHADWVKSVMPFDKSVTYFDYENLQEIYRIYPLLDDRSLPIFDIDKYKMSLLNLGFIIHLTAEKGLYPLDLEALYTACNREKPESSSDFKQFLFELGKLAINKRSIPFSNTFLQDNKPDILDTIPKKLFQALEQTVKFENTMNLTQFRLIQDLQKSIASELKLNFGLFELPHDSNDVNKYLLGILIYRMAMKNEYPIDPDQLKAMAPKTRSSWSINLFSPAVATNEHSVTSFKELFFSLGEMACNNKIPFELDSIDAQVDLSEPCKNVFKRGLVYQNFTNYDDYQIPHPEQEQAAGLGCSIV